MKTMKLGQVSVLALSVLASLSARAAPVIFSGSSIDASDIQAVVNQFRATLGTLNPNTTASFSNGRREINWDGVPDSFASPNSLPGNFFNVNSPRGVVLSTPGTAFQVSANAGGATPVEFGNINPAYGGQFRPYSPQRLFAPVGSNVVDVSFFLPGSTTAALTNGFGSVFTDVDFANVTGIEFFGENNVSLYSAFAPPAGVSSEGLSFLAVYFTEGNVISRVRITSGTTALGPNDGGNIDVVALDDFIYGEPRRPGSAAIPEPGNSVFIGLTLIGLIRVRSRCRSA